MPVGRGSGFDLQQSGFQSLARDLRAAGDTGKGIKKELRKEMQAAGKPMLADAKRRVRAAPSTRRKSRDSLRASIARALRIKITISARATTMRLEVNETRMPEHLQGLAARMEGVGRPWRHPVPHAPDVWVTQPSHPYIHPAAEAHQAAVRAGVARAVDKAMRLLEEGKP